MIGVPYDLEGFVRVLHMLALGLVYGVGLTGYLLRTEACRVLGFDVEG